MTSTYKTRSSAENDVDVSLGLDKLGLDVNQNKKNSILDTLFVENNSVLSL